MECWSTRAIHELVIKSSFTESNYGLSGSKTGKKSTSFWDMCKTFFPPPDTPFNNHFVWKPYVTKGYLKVYHLLCNQLSQEDVIDLNNVRG